MNNGWSQKLSPLVSFSDVMSEQLADSLVEDDFVEDTLNQSDQVGAAETETAEVTDLNDTNNDEALARALQSEWDKEYNENLSREEQRVNRFAKVKLSLDNYRVGTSYQDSSSENEDYDSEGEDYADDIKPVQSSGKTIITKHDKEICNRRNVSRMETSFPAGFLSGDMSGSDLQISNKTYNSLKRHAINEQRRGQRVHEAKDHYTTEHVLDEKTRILLYKLVNNGILASINGIISVGKESIVLHATGGDSTQLRTSQMLKNDRVNGDIIPSECAVKIYKTTLNEFRTRDKYIKDDYRFKDRFKKLNPRKIIHMWAEKEMCNLVRMKEAGLPCPDVVLLKKHVLVMSFLGTDQVNAPKLKDAVLNKTQKSDAYSQVVKLMKTLFVKCRLVHADLSEYNLLWKNRTVWVIDVSQSVEPHHPHGYEFLYRDCQNVTRFFRSWGVLEAVDAMALFNDVSGLDLQNSDEAAFRSDIERLQNMSAEHAQQGLQKATQILTPA